MPTYPTVVIGIGGAGVEILSEVHEVAKESGDAEQFRFIAIDSDRDTLEAARQETDTIHLDPDPTWIPQDKTAYPYLTEGMAIGIRGTQRQRPVGRYSIDHRGSGGFEDVFEKLSMEIDAHYKEHTMNLDNTSSFNIFLIHSFGGGTGSGSYPLVMSMLHEIKHEQLQACDEIVYIGGVGIVSELKFDPGHITEVFGGDYYSNTYAALCDLQTLIGADEDSEVLELPVWSRRVEETDAGPHTFELQGVPFNDYWLVGVDEARIASPATTHPGPESYLESLDRTVAHAVHNISKFDQYIEDWPNWAEQTPFTGTFDQLEISVPHDRVRSLVEAEEELETKRERVAVELPEQIRDCEARRRELKNLKSTLDPDEHVDDALTTEIREFLDEEGFRDGMTIIQDRTADELRDILAEVEERSLEAQVVVTETLRDRLGAEDAGPAVEAACSETIQGLWNKYGMESTPGYGTDHTQSLERKADSLEAFLEDRIDEFTGTIDNWDPSFLGQLRDLAPPVTETLESDREYAERWLEVLRDDYEALNSDIERWDRLNRMREAVQNSRARTRSEMDERIDDLNGEITALENERDSLEDELRTLNADIASLRESLTEPWTSERIAVLPLNRDSIEDIDRDTLENDLTSLLAYVEEGYVDEAKLHQALQNYSDYAAAWDFTIIQRDFSETDESPRFDDTDEAWCRFHEANDGVLEYLGGLIADTPRRSGDITNLPYLSDPYRIEFVSFSRRGPISALETFQRYENLSAEGLDELTTQYEDYRQAFAYPEWYGRELGIVDGFDGNTLSVPYPPELVIERVNKPGPDTEELNNYIRANGLDAYLWLGDSWENYEPEEEPFTGWKEKLRDCAVDFRDLQKASPDTLKAEWLADQCDWEDVVNAYRENLAEQTNLRIEFERA